MIHAKFESPITELVESGGKLGIDLDPFRNKEKNIEYAQMQGWTKGRTFGRSFFTFSLGGRSFFKYLAEGLAEGFISIGRTPKATFCPPLHKWRTPCRNSVELNLPILQYFSDTTT